MSSFGTRDSLSKAQGSSKGALGNQPLRSPQSASAKTKQAVAMVQQEANFSPEEDSFDDLSGLFPTSLYDNSGNSACVPEEDSIRNEETQVKSKNQGFQRGVVWRFLST